MARNKGQQHYSPEVKQAVLAALLAGQGVYEVAKQFKIHHSTISRWRARKLHEIAPQVQANIATLLMDYLRETISALTERARLSKNELWFSKQCAADIADLDGVQFDRAIRLLEAIERANAQRPAIPETVP